MEHVPSDYACYIIRVSPSELVTKKSPGVVSSDINSGLSKHQYPPKIDEMEQQSSTWVRLEVARTVVQAGGQLRNVFVTARGDAKSRDRLPPVLFRLNPPVLTIR